MNLALEHRGPDDNGSYISEDKKLGFGHTRLSIIDLSSSGHQPMIYKNRYVITFNGEIYNYQILKNKLSKNGILFKTKTDTEVILVLYSKYGPECLKYLRGMFAFAIYDLHKKTLFLARDRLGKKPFKYSYNDNWFIFASELKAILTQPEIETVPDMDAIYKYLTYGYVPAPQTGFTGIQKLEPGHYIFIDIIRKSFVKKRYWQPKFRGKLELSEKEWKEKILITLEESTKLRLISDVPVGAFLSGGVDSSAVVAAMANLTTKKIDTFTIVFEDKNLSEKTYAQKISNLYKTNYHEILAKPQSVEGLPEIAYQYEEPFADNSALISMMVSHLAGKYIKVVLNGDGGDENFAGYPNRYLRLKRDIDYDTWITKVRPYAAGLLREIGNLTHSSKVKRVENFFDKAKLPLYERFASYNRLFSPEELHFNSIKNLKKTVILGNAYKIVKNCFQSFKSRDLKDAGLKFDLMYFLPDDLLAKMDIATMSVGLEARSPLLDQEMVELACKIPFNLKVKHKETKYIFKKALEKIVPKENLYRKKVGFTIPLDVWFRGELNNYTEKVILSRGSFVLQIFNVDFVKGMIYNNNSNVDYGPKLWSLLTLELWHKKYFT